MTESEDMVTYETVNVGALNDTIGDFTSGLRKIAERVATAGFKTARKEYRRFVASHAVTFGLVLAKERLYGVSMATSEEAQELAEMKNGVDARYQERLKKEKDKERAKQ